MFQKIGCFDTFYAIYMSEFFFLFYCFLSAYHVLSERFPSCSAYLRSSWAQSFNGMGLHEEGEGKSNPGWRRRLTPSPIPAGFVIEGGRCLAYLGG